MTGDDVSDDDTPAAGPAGDPSADAAKATGFTWNPDGEDLAKALLARAKNVGRSSGSRTRSGAAGKRSGWRARRAPGAGWSGPGADDRDPLAVGPAVDKLIGEHGWEEDIAVHGVVARWDQLVGADVAAHVRPEHYGDGVLTVRADSTAWATQVRLLAANLVAKLNREIGDGAVVRVNVLGPQAPSWRKGPRSVRGRGPRDTYG